MFPIPYVCFHHLHLLVDKNSAFEICGFLFSPPLSNSVNFLFIAQVVFFYYYLHFKRCSNILTIGPSVYPLSSQNRQEGFCPPVVNQLSIFSFPGRGGAL